MSEARGSSKKIMELMMHFRKKTTVVCASIELYVAFSDLEFCTAHTISQRLRSLKKIPPELLPLGVVIG